MNYRATAQRIRDAKRLTMQDEFVLQSAFEFLRDSGYAETAEDAFHLAKLLEAYTSKVVSISGAYFTEATVDFEDMEPLTNAAQEIMSDELIADIENMLGEM